MGRSAMNSEDRERLGARLRGAREARGLGCTELAERLSISPETLSRWEGGQEVPDIRGLVDVASTLGSGLPELLGDDLVARVGELAARSRHELKTVYGALCLGWVVVFALEVVRTLGVGDVPWAVYAALLPPALWLSWRALSLERGEGVRTACDVSDYIERGARPADDEYPLTFLGWALKAVPLPLVIGILTKMGA